MHFDEADAINAAIRRISIRHRAQAAIALGQLGLHPGQETVLLLLEKHGEQTQAQLAHGAGCEPPSITGMVRKLEAAGLVTRRASSTDGRARVVALSSSGRALLPRLHHAWTELASDSVQGLTHTEVPALSAALNDLAASLESRHPPP